MAATKFKVNKSAAKNAGSSLLGSAYRHLTGQPLSGNTKPKSAATMSPSLQALTVAALSLPGLIAVPAHAAEEEASLLYGYYQESARNIYSDSGIKSRFAPITVDSLMGSSKISLSDRVKLAFNYTQDIWGGATPIATAPLSFGGNRQGGVISGATPYLQNNNVLFDRQFNPLKQDANGQLSKDTQLAHTMSGASPEIRKQVDFKLTHEWDETALDAGGGISVENDYQSRFGNLAGRWDLNQKRTSLNLGLSYTNSATNAILDHDAAPYIYDTSGGLNSYNSTSNSGQLKYVNGQNILTGNRQDWGTNLGLTQVLNPSALLQFGLGYTRSTGYMANPYKVVQTAFVDPNQSGDVLTGTAIGLLEKRPNERNQFTESLRYVQLINGLDAAVHFDYRFYHDDWGINAHTFQADWVQPVGSSWTVTPRIRYYSQSAADFYTPYLVSQQPFAANIIDPVKGQAYSSSSGGQLYYDDLSGTIAPPLDGNGAPIVNPFTGNALLDAKGNVVTDPAIANALIQATKPFDRSLLPANYSSDPRLSAYGALSGGITIGKQFAKGVKFEASAEYYTHAGSLKLGGGGEGAYSDYNYYMFNGVVKVDLSALSLPGSGYGGGHEDHEGHEGHAHHGSHEPAGVMFGHMLDKSGDTMVGLRYMYDTQAGNMQQGANKVGDQAIVANGCNGNPCYTAPSRMNMNMIMVDMMYAPTDWLTLMLMPQFVDMNMNSRALDGAPAATFDQQMMIDHHTTHQHTTGGIGDTGMYALVRLFDKDGHHIHATMGLSAPTGAVNLTFRDTHGLDAGFQHYGMQLGSGTWDLKPSVTYTGKLDSYAWGAQLSSTNRLTGNNPSGFTLGDIFQSTAWGSYSLLDWLSLSVRGVYTVQGTIKDNYNGAFIQLGPVDYTSNYGGRFWDVGFGINASAPSGQLQGNRLGFEWLQPVSDDVNGYQLPRQGALSATWSYAF